MFKAKFSKIMALMLAATMALSGCGGSGSSSDSSSEAEKSQGGEIKDLVLAETANNELSTFNYLYSQDSNEMAVLTNCADGLLSVDNKGKLVPSVAESWENEDGIKWTFHIRDGVKWVDMSGAEKAPCNAYDFATGLEWVLNFHKNGANNSAMPIEMVKGAKEYYDYTKELSEEEGKALTTGEGSKFAEMVGIEIPDANTVIYTCSVPTPYFDTLAPYVALYPLSSGLVEELGVDGVKAMDNTKMWYNGAYTITTYIQGNEKILTKNPLYWDQDAKRFDTLTFKMVEGLDVAYQLYETGEIDYISLPESNLKTISDNPDHMFYNYLVNDVIDTHSFQIHFNYNKLFPDGTPDENWNKAVANEAFRKSIYYGVDFGNFYRRTNMLDPYACQNNFYTMSNTCFTSDGRDYTDLVREKLGLPEDSDNMIRYNQEKGQEYKAQAMEELKAVGVTFPVTYEYWVKAGNQVAIDGGQVFKSCLEQQLGTDYVNVVIKEYVSSLMKEVMTPQLESALNNGWGLDYGDPMNSLGQEIIDSDNAWFSRAYSNINDVVPADYNEELLADYAAFTELVLKANAITDDLDARYEAFAEAEAFFIDNALAIPLKVDKKIALSRIDNSSRKMGMYGCQNGKAVNWNTNSNGYTTEEAKALEAAK